MTTEAGKERGQAEGALARGVVNRRRVVFGLWLLALALLVPHARRAEQNLEATAHVEGSESPEVSRILGERFGSPMAHTAMLVASGLGPLRKPMGRQALREIVEALRVAPRVKLVASYLDQEDPLFVGEDGHGTFVMVGLEPASGSLEVAIPALRAVTEGLARRLRRDLPQTRLRWTGEAALNVDLRRSSGEEIRAAELRALPLTLSLLVLAFGTAVAAMLPLIAGGLAITLGLGAAVLVSGLTPLTVSAESIISMLGLGLGIDFSLLTVARFREALATGRDAGAAAQYAAHRAGRTVWLSSATVAIGLMGLLAVPLNELRSVAVGGLLVVVLSALIATTLLPAGLAAIGLRVDTGRLRGSARAAGEPAPGWRRWGRWVCRHPAMVLGVASVPLLLLSAQALRLNVELPRGDWLPSRMESAEALRELRAMGRGGVVQAVRVIVELPEDVIAVSSEGWQALRRIADALEEDPRVARVLSLRSVAGDRADDLAFIAFLPAAVKHCYLSQEADAALLELIPVEHATPNQLSTLVRELRRLDARRLTGLAGTRLRVGGLPAFNADYADAVARPSKAVAGLVLGGTLLALLLGFRSLLIPLKALALNLLSVTAALGAVVLVFQEGLGIGLLGLAGPTLGVFPAVPILVFCIVFGLSMDYEVFLVSRVAESRRAGADETAAVVEGLARTGGVITNAAAIMIVVFAAFTLGSSLLVKMLGFALAVAVLLDATVIRVAVCPALLRLAGRWNWWPGAAAGDADGPSRRRFPRGAALAAEEEPCRFPTT